MSVGPVAEGWIAHLQDDSTAAEIYRSVDLNEWIDPSRTRLELLKTLGFPNTGSFEVASDPSSALPSLRLKVEDSWTSPTIPICEVWLDAGPGLGIARVYTDFAGDANTNFVLVWFSAETANATSEASADLFAASAGTITAEPVSRRFFGWQWRYSTTSAGSDGSEFTCDLRRLAVYGNHGLAPRGTEPEAGLYASDVIANSLSRWAPALNFTTGPNGSLRSTANVIAHLCFKEQTTPLAILEACNAFESKLYAVWENRTFYYYDWGDVGRRWRARVGPTELSETGPSTERLRNGVKVRFQDVDGSSKTAGPIGSGCDIEDEALEDRDPENPANKRGIRMWGETIDLGIVTVDSEAVRVGGLILQRLKETDRSGQAKLVGTCIDDKGVLRPAWQVRAGDLITFVDAADTSERRIIRTDYDDGTKTNTITLDAPPDGVPDLLAQLGVGIADLGI